MRNRRKIMNGAYLKAGGLKRADRGLASCARPLHKNLDFLHSVLDGFLRRLLGSDLRGKRSGFFGSLKTRGAGRRPANRIALRVRDRHDRVVEAREDVSHPAADHF